MTIKDADLIDGGEPLAHIYVIDDERPSIELEVDSLTALEGQRISVKLEADLGTTLTHNRFRSIIYVQGPPSVQLLGNADDSNDRKASYFYDSAGRLGINLSPRSGYIGKSQSISFDVQVMQDDDSMDEEVTITLDAALEGIQIGDMDTLTLSVADDDEGE